MVRAAWAVFVATVALTAFAAPAQAITLDMAPAGLSLPVTGSTPLVTTGAEVRMSTSTFRGEQGVKIWSPSGWHWDGRVVVSTGVHAYVNPLISGPAWRYRAPTLPDTHRVSRKLRYRAIKHCGIPDTWREDRYVAMVTRNAGACRDFAALGLRISAWQASQSYTSTSLGTLPPTPGWACTVPDTDLYNVRCTDASGRCVELLTGSGASQVHIRRGRDRCGAFTYAGGRMPC